VEKPIVLIGIPGSTLVDEVADCLGRADFPYCILSLDAPFEGKAVTVAPDAVFWEGVDLLKGGAIFVERPVFPWPQMLLPTEPFHFDLTHEEWLVFQREASALIVSALRVVAEVRPVINPPAAAHLAVSPSIALDRLAREGIPVHSWRLEPAPSGDRSKAGFVLDACGRDRWHSPQSPQAGEPALVLESFPGEVVTFIVVGGTSVGALRYSSGGSWVERYGTGGAGEARKRVGTAAGEDSPEPLDALESVAEAEELANRTAAALGLGFAAVSIRTGASPHSVLLCEAGPDLAEWNRIMDGRLAAALADHLISVASK
jgi:hypothetical protein